MGIAWSKDFGTAKGQSSFHPAAGEIPASISSQNGSRPRKGKARGFAMSNIAAEVLDLFKTLLRKLLEKPVRRRAGETKNGVRG